MTTRSRPVRKATASEHWRSSGASEHGVRACQDWRPPRVGTHSTTPRALPQNGPLSGPPLRPSWSAALPAALPPALPPAPPHPALCRHRTDTATAVGRRAKLERVDVGLDRRRRDALGDGALGQRLRVVDALRAGHDLLAAQEEVVRVGVALPTGKAPVPPRGQAHRGARRKVVSGLGVERNARGGPPTRAVPAVPGRPWCRRGGRRPGTCPACKSRCGTFP